MSHRNNFDPLRLALAGIVVVFHLAALSAMPQLAFLVPALGVAAGLAISGFFIISGYLVYASHERAAGVADYASRRGRRLLPAYATVVLGAALVALVVVPAARADLPSVGRYLLANLTFLNFLAPALPGVFEDNPLNEVNGALWTIKVEVMFYVTVPILAWALARMRSARQAVVLMAAIYIGAELWREGFEYYARTTGGGFWHRLSYQMPGQMAFFISGVALLRWREALLARPALLLAGAMALAVASIDERLIWLRPAGMAGLVLWIAYAAPYTIPAARFGDLSYGVYILHCPIIQVAVALGLFAAAPWPTAAGVLVAVVLSALVLWWTVEKPALRRDSHYRRAAVGSGLD